MSDVLPYGRLWYGEPNAISNAVDYAKFYSRSELIHFLFYRHSITNLAKDSSFK
jgi:hypothetical protein